MDPIGSTELVWEHDLGVLAAGDAAVRQLQLQRDGGLELRGIAEQKLSGTHIRLLHTAQ